MLETMKRIITQFRKDIDSGKYKGIGYEADVTPIYAVSRNVDKEFMLLTLNREVRPYYPLFYSIYDTAKLNGFKVLSMEYRFDDNGTITQTMFTIADKNF